MVSKNALIWIGCTKLINRTTRRCLNDNVLPAGFYEGGLYDVGVTLRTFQRPVYQRGLKQQPDKPFAVGIQPERAPPVHVLGNIAGKNGGKKRSGHATNGRLMRFVREDQAAAQRDFGQAGVNDRIVFGERNPVGHLRAESLAGKHQVAGAGDNQRTAQQYPGGLPDGFLLHADDLVLLEKLTDSEWTIEPISQRLRVNLTKSQRSSWERSIRIDS